jgi:hypothetical protein
MTTSRIVAAILFAGDPRGFGVITRPYLTIVISLVFYGAMIGVPLFEPGSRAKLTAAFGPRPFGLPLQLLAFVTLTVLYLPAPWVIWHGLVLTEQAQKAGRLTIGLEDLLFSNSADQEVRRAKFATLAGITYFGVICTAWIIYAEILGI